MEQLEKTVKLICCCAVLYGVVDHLVPKKGIYRAVRAFAVLLLGLTALRRATGTAALSAQQLTDWLTPDTVQSESLSYSSRRGELLVLSWALRQQLTAQGAGIALVEACVTGENTLQITLSGTGDTELRRQTEEQLSAFLATGAVYLWQEAEQTA